MLNIRPATERDAYFLAPRLRQEDKKEIRVMSGLKPLPCLLASLELSFRAYAVEHNGKVVALYGVSRDPENHLMGVAWMLCSPGIRQVSRAFLKRMPELLEEFRELFPNGLRNFTLVQPSGKNIRWLKAAGFTITGQTPPLNGLSIAHFVYKFS